MWRAELTPEDGVAQLPQLRARRGGALRLQRRLAGLELAEGIGAAPAPGQEARQKSMRLLADGLDLEHTAQERDGGRDVAPRRCGASDREGRDRELRPERLPPGRQPG